MTTIVFLLEEPSARDLLEGLRPRLIPETVEVHYLVFEGKQDLEKRLARRIRGWLRPNTHFVVLRDQDAADCSQVKRTLVTQVEAAGRPDTLVRVACRELESWILGDWEAVAAAYQRPELARQARKRPYRDPDQLSGPVAELRRHIPTYQKRQGARRIGRLLDPERNRSHSFRVFCRGVADLVERI